MGKDVKIPDMETVEAKSRRARCKYRIVRSDKICCRAETTDLVYEKARLRRREHAIIIKTRRRLAVDLQA